MDLPPRFNTARKRRRSDEEDHSRGREIDTLDTAPGYQTGRGYDTAPIADQQFQPQQDSAFAGAQFPNTDTTITLHNDDPPFSTSSPQIPEEMGPEKVCFGMVPHIPARCHLKRSLNTPLSQFPVRLKTPTHFVSDKYQEILGGSLSEHGQMIQGLLNEATLDLYTSCSIQADQTPAQQMRPSSDLPCALDITIYGPLDLFEDIGTWFEDHQVYLQDPRECQINVRYYNPHRLSSDDLKSCPFVSEVVSNRSNVPHLESIPQQEDLLDILSSHDDLEETAQPRVISASLRRHQKQALTFMLRREQGWAFDNSRPDVWGMMDTDQGRTFLNRISNAYQSQEPPQCYGGIIADPMGLGKTLMMIALAATDLERANTDMDTSEYHQLNVSATLIVVPPPLIGAWEEQLSEHVINGGMKWHRHHRESRIGSTGSIDDVNIVLTTYHTVSSEWRNGNGVENSVLFSARWARIILDEAQLIRNANSKMSQAVCALASRSRWAVTGTPIQNRLRDLATLFKFIRAYPYTDLRCFDVDISRLWKAGEYEEAIKRLKRLSGCMLLRRPKETISLPVRRDLQCPVDFSTEERALYDKLRLDSIHCIDEALQRDLGLSKTGMYVNVLQQIESLRLVCNLGLHYHMRHEKAPQTSLEGNSWSSMAQGAFDVQREMEPLVCKQCRSTLEITETLFEDPAIPQPSAQFSSCLRYVCAGCVQRSFQARVVIECGHNPSCAMASISTSNNTLGSNPDEAQKQTSARSISLSSKAVALIADIKTLPQNDKCIVFSTWRLTLDMIEAGLEQACIPSVRFDGKVPQNERQEIVARFRTDPSVRVMLLTLSFGAAGLTLTAATRVYLMEPHWNPTLEEQALARIHRIGQTREVTTVRFYVRDSFEQHVMAVQESKKGLADLLLAPHDGGQADESQGKLETLRSLI